MIYSINVLAGTDPDAVAADLARMFGEGAVTRTSTPGYIEVEAPADAHDAIDAISGCQCRSAGVGAIILTFSTQAVAVVPGDTFQVLGYHNAGAGIEFLTDPAEAYVEVRAVSAP